MPICPLSALRYFLFFRPNVAGQLFIKVDGTPVYALDLNGVLQKLCEFLHLPANYIKLHSFCIGSTTYLHSIGVPTATIQTQGRWTSACFKHYICPVYTTGTFQSPMHAGGLGTIILSSHLTASVSVFG